jgi:hypothetical protein
MQRSKLRTFLLALSLGAVATAGAQTYGSATGDASDKATVPPATMPSNSPAIAPSTTDNTVAVPSTNETTVIIRAPAVPPTGIDARADAKCRSAGVNSYWECVNSYNGSQ